MQRIFLLILFINLGIAVNASDSLQVTINRSHFNKGDSIEFTCTLPDFAKQKLAAATLNVWIEDIARSRRWKFRYPMLNGEVSGALAVGDKIPDGNYAINFLVQRGFFRMSGEIIQHEKKDTSLNYLMVVKNKKGSYFDNTHVAADGTFRLKSTLFEDSAYFVFSYPKKERLHELVVKIETPLDSVFVPVVSATRFISVGKPLSTADAVVITQDTGKYVFTDAEPVDKTLLPGVTVTTTVKKRIEQFNEEYSRGLFQKDDAIIFDGLDNQEISRSISVLQFLQGRVPGLIIEKDSTGQDYARWRNEVVEIYVDEFKMDIGDHLFVRPDDIAMIKVYRPPANISSFSGGAGAIAIYTKTGKYGDVRSKHNFVVRGYNSLDSVWE